MNKIDGIFLDTNVFEAAEFEYLGNSFEKMILFSKKYSVQLYIDEMIKGEIKKRILNYSESLVEGIQNKSLKSIVKTFKTFPSRKKDISDEIAHRLTTQFEELLTTKIIHIVPTMFNACDLVNLYHSGIAPFNVDNKKNEFPDAIILLDLLKFNEMNSKQLLMISDDKGVAEFCSKNNINYLDRVSDALNFLLNQYDLTDIFEINRSQIEENVKKFILDDNITFEFYGMTFQYDDIETEYTIEYVEVESLNLISIDDLNHSISISATLKISFIVSTDYFPDYDQAIHDKEDDVWFTYSSVALQFNKVQNVEVEFDIFLNEHKEIYETVFTSIDESIFNFDPHNLQDEQIIHVEYTSHN